MQPANDGFEIGGLVRSDEVQHEPRIGRKRARVRRRCSGRRRDGEPRLAGHAGEGLERDDVLPAVKGGGIRLIERLHLARKRLGENLGLGIFRAGGRGVDHENVQHVVAHGRLDAAEHLPRGGLLPPHGILRSRERVLDAADHHLEVPRLVRLDEAQDHAGRARREHARIARCRRRRGRRRRWLRRVVRRRRPAKVKLADHARDQPGDLFPVRRFVHALPRAREHLLHAERRIVHRVEQVRREETVDAAGIVIRRAVRRGRERDQRPFAGLHRRESARPAAAGAERIVPAGVEHDDRQPRAGSRQSIDDAARRVGLVLRVRLVLRVEIDGHEIVLVLDLDAVPRVVHHRDVAAMQLTDEAVDPFVQLLERDLGREIDGEPVLLQGRSHRPGVVDGVFQRHRGIAVVADHERGSPARDGVRQRDAARLLRLPGRQRGGQTDDEDRAERRAPGEHKRGSDAVYHAWPVPASSPRSCRSGVDAG